MRRIPEYVWRFFRAIRIKRTFDRFIRKITFKAAWGCSEVDWHYSKDK